MKRRVRLSLIFAVGLVTGCLRSTDIEGSAANITGTWRYVALQTGPTRESLDGSLSLSRQSGASFEGRLDVQVVDVQTGQSRTANGIVTGSAPEGGTVDFDVSLDSKPRRHVGLLAGDTITGTWIASAAGGITGSGTFRAERMTR